MTESVREWFSAAAKRRRYVEVEVALAQAQAYLGIIPVEAAAAIVETAAGYDPDPELVAERMSAHGHPMMALVEVFADAVGEHGGWVHWGATTQNIQQTGDVLILRDVHAVVVDHLRAALGRLADVADVADETADLPMAARTGSTPSRSRSGTRWRSGSTSCCGTSSVWSSLHRGCCGR